MKLEATDIGRTASAADIIFEALRKAIVGGQLAEGEAIRQDHVARMFNTSRIPVREALHRLEQEGLVTAQRYRGAVVSRLSLDEIREIFEFRALLESNVIAKAVPRMTGESRREAQAYCEAFSNEQNPALWGDLNRKFHYMLYRDAGLPYHLGVVETALDKVDRYLRAQLALTDGMARARREHSAILEACLAGDAALAARLTESHIREAADSLVEYLKSQAAAGA